MNGETVYALDAGQHYAQTAVTTVSPARLILLMYDAVLGAVDVSRTTLRSDQPDLSIVSQQLGRAQEIIVELEVALDHEQGGAIASSLQGLYDYSRRRLIDANVSKDTDPLDEVTRIFTELRDVWAASVIGTEQPS